MNVFHIHCTDAFGHFCDIERQKLKKFRCTKDPAIRASTHRCRRALVGITVVDITELVIR